MVKIIFHFRECPVIASEVKSLRENNENKISCCQIIFISIGIISGKDLYLLCRVLMPYVSFQGIKLNVILSYIRKPKLTRELPWPIGAQFLTIIIFYILLKYSIKWLFVSYGQAN